MMACCMTEEQREQRKINQEIERQLKKDAWRVVRLHLLGKEAVVLAWYSVQAALSVGITDNLLCPIAAGNFLSLSYFYQLRIEQVKV